MSFPRKLFKSWETRLTTYRKVGFQWQPYYAYQPFFHSRDRDFRGFFRYKYTPREVKILNKI